MPPLARIPLYLWHSCPLAVSTRPYSLLELAAVAKCDRCNCETDVLHMSSNSTAMLCPDCFQAEERDELQTQVRPKPDKQEEDVYL